MINNAVYNWLSGELYNFHSKENILKELKRCLNRLSKTTTIECAENATTICREKTIFKGVNQLSIAQKAYEMGWRNINYTGTESIVCPECLESIKDNLTWWQELKIQEYKT